jgi:hypothetical protein
MDFGGEEPTRGAPKTSFRGFARFIGASVKAYLSFIAVEFEDIAWFDGMTVDGDARFDDVRFLPKKQVKASDFVSFYGIHISGQTVFDGARFGVYVRFDQARLDADSSFCSTQFMKRARFDNAVFGGPVRFIRREDNDPPVMFEASAEFAAVSAPDIHFEETEFRGDVRFRDASIKTLRFQDAENEKDVCRFPHVKRAADGRWSPRIDLRGLAYDRMIISREGIRVLESIEPFDIQPYRQAEKVFRTMGDSSSADRVYLMQRRRTLLYHLKRPRHWLKAFGELLYWAAANFGIRPYRLAVYTLILITVSTYLFMQPGAVAAKKDTSCVGHQLHAAEAFGVSVAYFLPVEVPTGSCWEATRERAIPVGNHEISFLLWATVLRLSGWIVVPLGVAALSGLLRREARA